MSATSNIKSQLIYKASIEKAYDNFKKSPKERRCKETYLQTRLDALEDKWKVFSETHKSLSLVAQIEETDYISLFDDVEEKYIEYKADLKDAIRLLKPIVQESSSRTVSHQSNNIKLPKINIVPFSGSYVEWSSFKNLYESLVHNNKALDDVQKMHYLKGYLTGEAEQLLRHLPITAASYQEAWNILNDRYNNKKYLANCLLRRFMGQATLGTESSEAIKQLLDVTNETLSGLKNLGIEVTSWDVIVIYIIGSKLDSESRKEWEFRISSSDELPTMNQMREFLQSRFRSLEFLSPKQKEKSHSSNHKVMHATSSESAVRFPCLFCKNNDHKLANCKEFSKKNYEQRHSFVQTTNLCFNCLGKNHSAYMCRVDSRCQICRHKHHSLLHPSQKSSLILPKSELEEEEVKPAVSSVQSAVPESTSVDDVKTHFSQGKSIKQNEVLLTTAVVGARAKDGRVRLLRALIDQGSQGSFVTESVVQILGLRKELSRCNISGLGGDGGSLASKHVVEISIQSRHDPKFQIKVRAQILRTITGLLPSKKVENMHWPELAYLPLADPRYHTPKKIDILLGADVYGQIMKEGLIQGPDGVPTAQNTAFGWIISGPTRLSDDQQFIQCHHNVVNDGAEEGELLKKVEADPASKTDSKLLSQEEQRCETVEEREGIREEMKKLLAKRRVVLQKLDRNSKELARLVMDQGDKAKLKPLNIYLDVRRIIRMRSRMQKADLTEDTKHPIILSQKSHFTDLVIKEAHKGTLHRGPSLMVSHLRSRVWRRWSSEYLVYCVPRYKWSKVTTELKVGAVVVVREDSLPPDRWK